MNRFNPWLLVVLGTSLGILAASPAFADDASCKAVSEAAARMAHTPYHEVAVADGKSFEKIYTTTTLSLRGNDGKWITMPMTPKELLDNMRESGSAFVDCKVLRTEIIDGQRATVYAARSVRPGSTIQSEDEQIWIAANGLTVKTVSDVRIKGRVHHAESHVTFTNVHAPPNAD